MGTYIDVVPRALICEQKRSTGGCGGSYYQHHPDCMVLKQIAVFQRMKRNVKEQCRKVLDESYNHILKRLQARGIWNQMISADYPANDKQTVNDRVRHWVELRGTIEFYGSESFVGVETVEDRWYRLYGDFLDRA